MSGEPVWARVKVVFQSALEQPADLRSSFVANACGTDGPLRAEVESLLSAYDASGALDSQDALASLSMASLSELSAADPDLVPGSRIDVYDIVGLVGRGSMGQIFKALDSRLGRAVALKALSPSLARDPASLARFEREARTIASLNHPHICTLFDVGHSQRFDYLVMEYLEGETLTDLLRRGPLPVEATRRYAADMIDALDAAHRTGVVHRDLKPANVMITDSGAKLLDFGIAKLIAHDGIGSSPADVAHGTRDGSVLGTAGYMSPEQARGQEVDKRTDVWAFGCLLFEMLSGRPAFVRDTFADTLAAVLEREPEWSLLPGTTPRALIRLMRRCLERDVSRRLRDIADARADLEDLDSGAGANAAVPWKLQPVRALPWVIAAAAVGLAAIVTVTQTGRDVGPSTVDRRWVVPPEGTTFVAFDASGAPQFAVSPVAREIVTVLADTTGVPRLWLQALNSTSGRILTGTDDASGPFWSPDGTAIAFFANRELKRIVLHTGEVRVLAPAASDVPGGSWSHNGTILFGGPGGLLRVSSVEGGLVKAVTTVDERGGELLHRWPQFLPDGRRFLFYVRNRDRAKSGMYVGSLDSQDRRLVLQSAVRAIYSPTGHLLFERAGNLMAWPFDDASAMPTGNPTPLPDRVVALGGPSYLSVSAGADTVAYWSGDGRPTFDLHLVDRKGDVILQVLPPGQYIGLDMSRDGSRALVTKRIESQTDVLWTIDLTTRPPTREQMTLRPGIAHFGILARDGTQAIYSSLEDGTPRLYRKTVPGNSQESAIPSLPEPNAFPTDWSSDGQWVLYSAPGAMGWDIFALRMGGKTVPPRPLVQFPGNQIQARLSPNRRWVAYASDENGRYEVYVQSFDNPGVRTPVSPGGPGGSQPTWGRDGRELFYIRADGMMMAVDFTNEPRVEKALFPTRSQQVLAPFTAIYAVGDDSATFLIRSEIPSGASRTIRVATNALPKRGTPAIRASGQSP